MASASTKRAVGGLQADESPQLRQLTHMMKADRIGLRDTRFHG
jgi:hypothetical protein